MEKAALTVTLPSDTEIVLSRVFDAPRALVFEAWTKPEHLARWWGPNEFSLAVCEVDLRPGGAYRFVMRGPDGKDYPMKGEYREIVAPERLVYTDAFDVPDMPARESLVTVTFAEEGGGTKLTIHSRFQSVEDRNAVLEMGAEEGWRQSLERLAEHLGTMS